MLNKLNSKKTGGFTLVEIMIVVAIIALLAAVAVPSFLRARQRSQATSIKNDLRLIDAAVDQYAIETNRAPEFPVRAVDIAPYLKTGTRLEVAASSGTVTDLFGRTIVVPSVDNLPRVPSQTFTDLAEVADASFWAPYTN